MRKELFNQYLKELEEKLCELEVDILMNNSNWSKKHLTNIKLIMCNAMHALEIGNYLKIVDMLQKFIDIFVWNNRVCKNQNDMHNRVIRISHLCDVVESLKNR